MNHRPSAGGGETMTNIRFFDEPRGTPKPPPAPYGLSGGGPVKK